MAHPYSSLPDSAFWSRSVTESAASQVLALSQEDCFTIAPSERLASAGSCFAQHLARLLPGCGFNYLVTETGPADRQFGVYPARFGNLYTVRQLLQLFERAYGLFEPTDRAWTSGDVLVDPFRPGVENPGFADLDALLADRGAHFAAVRRMFEQCDVFVFTMGLTEAWVSDIDGAVFPLAPGVRGVPPQPSGYRHRNFTVPEMVGDMQRFVTHLRLLNPGVKLVLSVSPVPMAATYERRGVLVSNGYTKAALRVVADMVVHGDERVAYFPSYEAIAGHQAAGRYYEPDRRHISAEGVREVVDLFTRSYLARGESAPPLAAERPPSQPSQNVWDDLWCEDDMLNAS